jgi:hypothetical protein
MLVGFALLLTFSCGGTGTTGGTEGDSATGGDFGENNLPGSPGIFGGEGNLLPPAIPPSVGDEGGPVGTFETLRITFVGCSEHKRDVCSPTCSEQDILFDRSQEYPEPIFPGGQGEVPVPVETVESPLQFDDCNFGYCNTMYELWSIENKHHLASFMEILNFEGNISCSRQERTDVYGLDRSYDLCTFDDTSCL